MKKRGLIKYLKKEQGQALLIVLVFLLLGSLMLPPLLAFMSTSLKNDGVYEGKSDSLYAADAGVEDAMWTIQNPIALKTLAGGDDSFQYDFTTNWTYELENPVNGLTTNVTISNVWLPSNITLSELGLSAAAAYDVVERSISANETNRLVVTGTPLDEDDYRIKIDYYPAIGETSALEVDSIGVWLPQGFTYDDDCNLASFGDCYDRYTETVETRPGGEAVVWDFSVDPLLFTDLPPIDLDPSDDPQSAEITFKYDTSDTSVRPAAVAWYVTSGNLTADIPISWDIETRYYKITSAAGGTDIETYASRSELRDLNSKEAIDGEYVAFGNSLMTDESGNDYIRETLKSSSSYELDTLPEDAVVDQAWLYWSGFFNTGYTTPEWGIDPCEDFDDWTNTTPNTVWQIDSYYDFWERETVYEFCGHYTGSDPDARYLELTSCVDMSGCPSGKGRVEWDQREEGSLEDSGSSADILKFQISGDDGATWSDNITAFAGNNPDSYYFYTLPDAYLTDEFKIRFYLDGFSGSGEYCYLDDIAVSQVTGTADTVIDFTIDGCDTYTEEDLVAESSQVLPNSGRGQYSFACKRDVGVLVKAHCDQGPTGDPIGNAVYTVGEVDSDTGEYLSYCGWSLIIVYYSPDTAQNQFYMWDDFSYSSGGENLDFDDDGEPGGHIEGFIIPEQIEGEDVCAKLTCFVGEGDECYSGDYLVFNSCDPPLWDGTTSPVPPNHSWGDQPNSEAAPYNCWNAKSVDMTYEGVDIDTFTIYWDDGLLHADDTEAYIDLYTEVDNYNLIYIILSVRSEVTMSSTTHYVING